MIMNDFGTQSKIKPLNYDDNDKEPQTECESSDSDESEYHQSENKYDDDNSSDTPLTDFDAFKNCFCCLLVALNDFLKKPFNLFPSCNCQECHN